MNKSRKREDMGVLHSHTVRVGVALCFMLYYTCFPTSPTDRLLLGEKSLRPTLRTARRILRRPLGQSGASGTQKSQKHRFRTPTKAAFVYFRHTATTFLIIAPLFGAVLGATFSNEKAFFC
jgi:hypothetical protein